MGYVSQIPSLRGRFYEKVQSIIATLPQQGVILALSFADKSLISFEQKTLFKKLGITHLLAISGLHIGLFFSFFYLLLSYFCKRLLAENYLGWQLYYIVNYGALCGVCFYAYLAGFSLPTQRALLMLAIAVFLLSLKRRYFLTYLLMLVLFLILLWDPLSILSLSLWLSFAAITIILLIIWRFSSVFKIDNIDKKRTLWQTSRGYIKALILIQLGLTLLMLPLQLLSFSAFNLFAPVVNFIAVPLFSLLIIPLVLFACLLTIFAEPLASGLFTLADYLIGHFLHYIAIFSEGYEDYSFTAVKLIMMAICLLVVILIIHYQRCATPVVTYLFSVLLVFFVGISLYQEEQQQEKWFVEVLDVGQGLSVLIRSQGQYMLYDTGPSYPSGFVTAKSEILPYLNSLGITTLDYLFVSHSDNDHAGGLATINHHFAIKQIIMGEPLPGLDKEVVTRQCKAGQRWLMGRLTITALSPNVLTRNNNNNSCVLRVSDGLHSLLLTGDIEKKQELLLVKNAEHRLASDILFAPHHGSRYSSSATFIRSASPQWVVFTSGFMNRWGFPDEQVKLRYKNQSVKMVNSGLSGFVRFTIDKEQIKIQTYREDLASYWYHHSLSS
ncbi:DNA internalization-related competence protein ComEC/Rec2 [Psychromonas sp. MME2]|uniref:DNA internalization-related competence protein ComEC/Rec2 n=1 Tax=Psychromonas sp. MME2 TaxID=3231033 RepID=UPI00339C14DB